MTFLELIFEGIAFGKKKMPRARVTSFKKVASSRGNDWRTMPVKRKPKKIIPRKLSLLSGRTLINQTNSTRSVWDPKGYKAQIFYDKIYKSL